MKIKQEFKDIERPEDIVPAEISAYLCELYGQDKFDINDPSYDSENREFRANWDGFVYKQQVDIIIRQLVELSGLSDFEHLRKHYTRPISAGVARVAAEEEKTFAEYICFKLAKRKEKVNLVKFKDEVKAATLDKCIGGAARNLQMIFFSMEQAEYYQKYNFISHIALEYVRDNKLVTAGNEPHAVNKLIHEVSIVYKLVPPRDNYVIYRNLASPVPSNMEKYAEFYPYVDNFMNSRVGVYSLVSFLTNDLMSKFPTVEDLNIVEDDLPIGKDTSSKSIVIINDLLRETGIDNTHIITEDRNGNYIYKDNYQEIIEVIMMQKLMANQMVQFAPIILEGNRIIEVPSGWFLVKREDRKNIFEKYLVTSGIEGLTIDNKRLDDYFHDTLKQHFDNNPSRVEDAPVIEDLLEDTDQYKFIIELLVAARIQLESKQEINDLYNFAEDFKKRRYSSFYEIELSHTLLRDKEGKINLAKYLIAKELKGDEYITNLIPEWNRNKYVKYLFLGGHQNIDNLILHKALREGSPNIVIELLLVQGVDINAQDDDGNTALHTALYTQRMGPYIDILIKYGAETNIRNKAGLNPAEYAEWMGYSAASIFPPNCNIDMNKILSYKDKKGHTILYNRISNKKGIADLLPSIKDLTFFSTSLKKSLLNVCVDSSNEEAAFDLLKAGVDQTILDQHGNTFMHHAIDRKYTKKFIDLIDRGGDLTIKNKNGDTVIEYAKKKLALAQHNHETKPTKATSSIITTFQNLVNSLEEIAVKRSAKMDIVEESAVVKSPERPIIIKNNAMEQDERMEIDSIVPAVTVASSSSASSASWQEKLGKRALSAEEVNSESQAKRARTDSFAERLEGDRDGKEHKR